MTESFGTGVSRTLSALARQFDIVVTQQEKPPLDSEWNLIQQIQSEKFRQSVKSRIPSGFLNQRRLVDYLTNPLDSNQFYMGQASGAPLTANVNGWLIPLLSTNNNGQSNRITLPAPPATERETNFVFLEVWKAQVSPNPSTINKPSASTLWSYGNVESGVAGQTDDLEDPSIGFETTERVQLQYRFRIVQSVDAAAYPDGLDDPLIAGQGTLPSPGSFNFSNLASEGDPTCWRAGNGDPTNALGTVDGYVYAIPVCFVFRRNRGIFVAINGSTPNHNGALNRNQTSNTLGRSAATRYTTATLTSSLAIGDTGDIDITSIETSALGDAVFAAAVAGISPVYLTLMSGVRREVILIDDVDLVGGTVTVVSRGHASTVDTFWPAGTEVSIYNSRYDGLYADQIAEQDILDLRRSPVEQPNSETLLRNSLKDILSGKLRSSWKTSPGAQSAGHTVTEVSYLRNTGAVPTDTIAVDGPDGLRQNFSAAVHTERALLMLDPTTVDGTTGLSSDFLVASSVFSLQAPITATGFIPNPTVDGWKNGSVIIMDIDEVNGIPGSNVRLLSPTEEWQSSYNGELAGPQTPVFFQFLGEPNYYEPWGSVVLASARNVFSEVYGFSDNRVGPAYPVDGLKHEPFIFLGGVVHEDWQVASLPVSDFTAHTDGQFEVDMGIDFDDDTYGIGSVVDLDSANVTTNLLYGTRSLYSMVTAGGKDPSGYSSELYLVTYGDPSSNGVGNNGAFRIVGMGTRYGVEATNSTSVVVQAVGHAYAGNDPTTTESVVAEIRSPYTFSGDSLGVQQNSAVVVLTNLEGDGIATPTTTTTPVESLMLLRTTAVYGNNRGAFPTVPETIDGVFLSGAPSVETLREPMDSIDSDFTDSGIYPSTQIEFDPQPFDTWAKFPDKGDQKENSREGEVFFDPSSKTLVVRPYQDAVVRTISILGRDGGTVIIPQYYEDGSTLIDGVEVFQDSTVNDTTSTTDYAFPLPMELLPAFGRQDIPYNYGTGSFLPGINHLFKDTGTDTDDVYRIIGGPTVGAGGVESMLAWTSSDDYGTYDTIAGTANFDGYRSRIITLRSEISSQTGNLMRGIELPPFMGVARLYGVYERADYLATEDAGIPGGFDADRVTPRVGGPTNLLREGADRQTLFIRKGGADVDTGIPDSHTYVVPEDALDLNRISGFDPSTENLADYNYVVEFVYFGFSPGFINRNPYILIRQTDGQAATTNNTTLASTPLTVDPSMVVPWAAPASTKFYTTFRRNVYQGDPYHTRNISSVNASEVPYQYGELSIPNAFGLATIAQQFNDAGVSDITMPLKRPLKVLASLDFWTTLGTGRLGTSLYAGTEPGWMGGNPIPSSATAPPRPPNNRALTRKVGTTPAQFTLQVNFYENVVEPTVGDCNASLKFDFANRTYATEMAPFTGSYLTVTSNEEMAEALYQSLINDTFIRAHFYVEQVGTRLIFRLYESGSLGNNVRVTLSPNSSVPTPVTSQVINTALTARFGESVDYSTLGVMYDGTYSLPGTSQGYLKGGSDESCLPILEVPRTYAGAVSRLPLGAAITESDFIGESVNGSLLGIQPTRSSESLIEEESEYIVQSEGAIQSFAAWNGTSGVPYYRTARGTALTALRGTTAAPIAWGLGKADGHPKGSVLVGRAYLVQNEMETAFSSPSTRTYGGELQVVIATTAIPSTHSPSLQGEIGAIGYGEGMSAADRYLIEGRPCAILDASCEVSMGDVTAEAFIEEVEADTVECVCP